MLEAGAWGLLGASSLLIGAVLGLTLPINKQLTGLVLGFGAGTLISAVAFELTDEAFALGGADTLALGLALGALTYYAGDTAIERGGAERRMHPGRRRDAGPSQGSDSAWALLLGAILDGIPESVVIGISLIDGGSVSAAVLAAVFISNLPESLASSQGMREEHVGARRILLIWLIVRWVRAAARFE
jgi:ZIP family zinc transporter